MKLLLTRAFKQTNVDLLIKGKLSPENWDS
jgi:hypothetical protein